MKDATSEVIVKTTGGMYRVGIGGPVPVPATAEEGDVVIEMLLDIGWRVADEKGETLVFVLSPETSAGVMWREEDGHSHRPSRTQAL